MRIKTLFIMMMFFTFSMFSFYLIAKNQKTPQAAPLFNNLGSFHHAIDTKNPLAQRYFDQGMVLFYSFEFGESIRSFGAAIKTDPDCAMCYWGLALALGSKTVMPMTGDELSEAKKMIAKAIQKADKLNVAERLYIGALAQRYANEPIQKMEEIAGICSSYSAVPGSNATKFAFAMEKVVGLLPEDTDAKTLHAFSLFDLVRWKFWTPSGKPKAHTLEIVHELESAMQKDKNHPGANHLYVHLMEWSTMPRKSLPQAKRLHELVPGSEHMAHMPCHTYYTLGKYHAASSANIQAIQIFKDYIKEVKGQGFEPEIQYLYFHNYDYLVSSASMEGRKALSIEAADELAKLVYPFVEKNPALQKKLTDKLLMRVRFGEWQDILNMPAPNSAYKYHLAMWFYAKGIAEVQMKQINTASKDLNDLEQIMKKSVGDPIIYATEKTLMEIAKHTLQGLIQSNTGQNDKALKNFQLAVKKQDGFTSFDPPAWYFPSRELLGAYLLKLGKYKDAQSVFEEDLQKQPGNGWSLYGRYVVSKSLGEKEEADNFYQKFKKAWEYADISVPIYYVSF